MPADATKFSQCGYVNPVVNCFNNYNYDPNSDIGVTVQSGAIGILASAGIVLVLLFVDLCEVHTIPFSHKLTEKLSWTWLRVKHIFHYLHENCQKYDAPNLSTPEKSDKLLQTRIWKKLKTFVQRLQENIPDRGAPRFMDSAMVPNYIYFLLWINYCFYRYFFLLIYPINSGPLNPTNWRFGQIIGITVWTPIIIEYFYLEMHKYLRSSFATCDLIRLGGMKKGFWYRIAKSFQVINVESKLLDEETDSQLPLSAVSHKG